MIRSSFILGCIIFLSFTSRAQQSAVSGAQKLKAYQDTLQGISFKMINDSLEPQRYNASYKFIKTLVTALKTSNSFNFPFDSLKSISIQTSSDKRFRIFSWNVMNADGSYRYYGTVQINNPDGKLQMFPLVDYTSEFKNPADSITTNDKWYGAQYYRIISVLNNVKTPYYMLLGWKGNNVKSTKKVIDVIHFKDNKAFFGMPVFDGDKDLAAKKRVIFEYDRKASMVLNWDPKITTIIFDHLAPPDDRLKGRFELYGPDFSYDGYRLANGRWKLVEDIEVANQPTDKDENFNDPKKFKEKQKTEN
ncbi:MAG: hypothetical protein H7069_07070 [Phormidesmis sp. FL-bin-119]|nr:hypothetical protein [Pedobacter sp.]